MAEMTIVRDLATYVPPANGTAVTIGAYDGVHLGHQAVLRLVRELADARGYEACCLTFDRHPAEVVRPESAPKLLNSLDQKLELLEATGYLDVTCVLPFDAARSKEPAEEFVQEVLVAGLRARLVVVGADFHFGYRRHGTTRLLEQMGAELGFEVLALGLVTAPEDPQGLPYSSTGIRHLLAEGRVADAAGLLGRPPRPYEVRGVVEPDRDARRLGLPLTKVVVSDGICLPADGVYAGWFVDDDEVRSATITVGRRRPPGVDADRSLLDAHVLDFDGDLDGQPVALRFVEWLHGPARSDSSDELLAHLRRDEETTRRLLDR
jgi:riboflavin kinase / FMN adenylyltransferase